MSSRTGLTRAQANELQQAVFKELLGRVKSGEASSADMSNAVKLLSNLGIMLESDDPNVRGKLLATLPEYAAEEKITAH